MHCEIFLNLFRGQLRKCKARKEESLALAGEETAKRGR